MTDKNTRVGMFGQEGAPSLAELVAYHEREKQSTRDAVLSGECKGRVDMDGSIIIFGKDSISSVRYGPGTSVTYAW